MKPHNTALAVALLVAACDAPNPTPVARGLEEVLYLSQPWETITLEEFIGINSACDGIQKTSIAVTLSIYSGSPGDNGWRHMGFGFAETASPEFVDCFRDQMIARGAHP